MNFKELLNKGANAVSKGIDSVKTSAMEKQKAIQEFDFLVAKSEHIGPFKPYEVKNTDPQIGIEQKIINENLSISVEGAKIINKAIPITETVICAKNVKEAKTEISYLFVMTDKNLIILNKNEYMIYDFNNIKNFQIINKGLLSQGVMFNDNAFVIDGNEESVQKFIDIIMNEEERNKEIMKHIEYLCGTIPDKQILNSKCYGITITNDKRVVVHNDMFNKIINPQEVDTVQVLINDSVVFSKGKSPNNSFVSAPLEARKMSVKIVLHDDYIVIPILEPSSFGTTYKREDSTFINHYDISKRIADEIISLSSL